jgi:hypothetical protein
VGVIRIANNQAVAINGIVDSGFDGNIAVGSQSLGSPRLGYPQRLSIACNTRDNAATITVFVSYDNQVTWVPATIRGTQTAVSFVLGAGPAGAGCEITPAPYVRFKSSAACAFDAWAYVTN